MVSSSQRYSILFLLCHLIRFSLQAVIGDGSVSLYTGQLINANDTRGSCLADGLRFPSETSIPRDHPCHYCICFQTQVTCYWKQCSAPPKDCVVMEFENVCNPSLYICDIAPEAKPEPILEFGARLRPRRKRKLWKKRLTRAVKIHQKLPVEEGFPVEFREAWQKYLQTSSGRSRRAIASFTGSRNLLRDTSCTVLGVKYGLGEVIGVSTDVCMECRCAADKMFCSPKCCFRAAPFSTNSLWQGNSIFIKTQSRGSGRVPNPLHYIRNQYQKGPFL